MFEFLLELLGDIVVQAILVLPGGLLRFLVLKPFQPKKTFRQYFVDDPTEYNALVGIAFFIGLIVICIAYSA